MKLEQNEMPLLFSNTSLPDVFFTEYLSQSNGDYIKVYLFMFFLSKYNKDIKINDLSKKLALPFNVIQDAVKYWEDLVKTVDNLKDAVEYAKNNTSSGDIVAMSPASASFDLYKNFEVRGNYFKDLVNKLK